MNETPGPVGGLYDQERLAQLLGIDRGTLRTARSRRPQGWPKVVGILNNGPVFDARECVQFALTYQPRPQGRPKKRT